MKNMGVSVRYEQGSNHPVLHLPFSKLEGAVRLDAGDH